MEYYLAIKNKEILPFPKTWIDLEGIDAKWNKTEKAILLYVECKNKKSKWTNKSEIDSNTENQLVAATGQGVEGWCKINERDKEIQTSN